jgi:hypothetical protein
MAHDSDGYEKIEYKREENHKEDKETSGKTMNMENKN